MTISVLRIYSVGYYDDRRMMINWEDFVGSDSGLLGVRGAAEENTDTSVKARAVPAENRTYNLLNTSLESYLLGVCGLHFIPMSFN
jgi:hypothetical protein